jgi:sulfur dioxygenase
MLPDECLVYPAHDYQGRTCSSIGEEKKFNPRIPEHQTEDKFVEIMNNLNLPRPKKFDVAVPANLNLGKPVRIV